MKKTTKIEYKAEREIVEEVICDMCKQKAINPNNPDNPFGENESYGYITNKVTIQYEDSESYYDGGGRYRKVRYDICPKCFEEKIRPFLNSMNAQPEEKEEYI